tara:strand:+ start:119741 stop:120538 length:798 start_codon:yes stop_codon:yes gene_type:complete
MKSLLMKFIIRPVLTLYVFPKNILLYLSGSRVKNNQAVNALSQEGFYIYPDLLPEGDVQALKNDYLELYSKKLVENSGQMNGRIYANKAISPLVQVYVDRFSIIAANYFGCKEIDCELTMYQKSEPQQDIANIPGGEFHMDDNKKNLKFFIYLSDVTITNGPFSYLPKTHGILSATKMIKWFLWEVSLQRRFLYVSAKNNKRMASIAVPVLGGSGTVSCVDTTGYHAAMQVHKGERLVMVVSFAEKRYDPYRFIEKNKVLQYYRK